MRNKILFLFSVLTFSLFTISMSEGAKKSYLYIDGNNNDYLIKSDSIYFNPVTPNESSSGEYNGGEPKTDKLTPEEFSKIESLIKSMVKDKKNHIDNRLMGCGTLAIGNKSLFIDVNSPLKSDLENYLNSCLK
ncbi:MAG: hypothetical protein IPM77_01905 [Crocinitomicaceae bacterium]|nr:hypothetical protein [Crocinitomicaceae bacterium]